jgi:hypothetical protein
LITNWLIQNICNLFAIYVVLRAKKMPVAVISGKGLIKTLRDTILIIRLVTQEAFVKADKTWALPLSCFETYSVLLFQVSRTIKKH